VPNVTSEVNLGRDSTVKLEQAILLYKGASGEQSTFVSLHDVQMTDGVPNLSAGRLLSSEALSILVEGLWRHRVTYLPEHVLASGPTTLVWWEPGMRRAMFFEAQDAAVNAISGRVFPQPALVFVAQRSGMSTRLQVFALERDARPLADTPLCLSPYWNASQGVVCMGSTQQPDRLEPENTREWSSVFFASAFTHGTSHLVVRTGQSYAEFWQSIERRKTFPKDALIPAGRTLSQVLS
jgi:PRTRC genetic system protein B